MLLYIAIDGDRDSVVCQVLAGRAGGNAPDSRASRDARPVRNGRRRFVLHRVAGFLRDMLEIRRSGSIRGLLRTPAAVLGVEPLGIDGALVGWSRV